MKVRRFQVDDLSADRVEVRGNEAVHALRVLRLTAGTEVILFDGRGADAHGRIAEVGDGVFTVEIVDRRDAPSPQHGGLTLAVATPKGERADWLVEKCAELGVAALWLLETERSEVHPGEGKLSRWRRKAVEAAKQAGHAITMTIEAPRLIAEVLRPAGSARILFGDPRHAKLSAFEAFGRTAGDIAHTIVLIGPEGGFTDAERAVIEQAGGIPIRLCSPILRVETAAVATASVWVAAATQQ